MKSFNGKLWDQHLAREVFDTLPEATVLIARWRKARARRLITRKKKSPV